MCVLQSDEQEEHAGQTRPEGPERKPGSHPRPRAHDPGVQETLSGSTLSQIERSLRSRYFETRDSKM